MPDQSKPNQGPSPFEIVTPGKSKKAGNKGVIVAVLIVVFLILSVVAGVLLVRQQQNIQEKAAASQCPAAEACPAAGNSNLLRNCHPPEGDNSPAESLCNKVGKQETCGTRQFCCPAVGGAWTTDLTACATPAPTPTPNFLTDANNCGSVGFKCTGGTTCQAGQCVAASTATPTPTASASASSSASPTPTQTATPTPAASATTQAQTTPLPIPETGTGWPTILGAGMGIVVIIASILVAL
jgi:hypothetical protein